MAQVNVTLWQNAWVLAILLAWRNWGFARGSRGQWATDTFVSFPVLVAICRVNQA